MPQRSQLFLGEINSQLKNDSPKSLPKSLIFSRGLRVQNSLVDHYLSSMRKSQKTPESADSQKYSKIPTLPSIQKKNKSLMKGFNIFQENPIMSFSLRDDSLLLKGQKFIQKEVSCRYCLDKIEGNPFNSKLDAFYKCVCRKNECLKFQKQSCQKIHSCGHACKGKFGEKTHLPCLEPECVKKRKDEYQDAESDCALCYVSNLGQQPCIKLRCNHIYHSECLKRYLNFEGDGRLLFKNIKCPYCNDDMNYLEDFKLNKQLQKQVKLKNQVDVMALEYAKRENLDKDENFQNPKYEFHNKLKEYALYKLVFYQCYKCKQPYYGGKNECGQNPEVNKKDLICPFCKLGELKNKFGLDNQSICEEHGQESMIYKCKYCCNQATFFCFGNTHFCEDCHKLWNQGPNEFLKREIPNCYGGRCNGKHLPNRQEFIIGCNKCLEQQLLR